MRHHHHVVMMMMVVVVVVVMMVMTMVMHGGFGGGRRRGDADCNHDGGEQRLQHKTSHDESSVGEPVLRICHFQHEPKLNLLFRIL